MSRETTGQQGTDRRSGVPREGLVRRTFSRRTGALAGCVALAPLAGACALLDGRSIARPKGTDQQRGSPSPAEQSFDDRTVRSFDRTMIEAYLARRGLQWMKDRDGDFRVQFGDDKDVGRDLTVWLIAAGRRNQIFVVRVETDARVPRRDWERAYMMCNTWNKEKRWPKAYLYVRSPATDTTGTIYLEEQIDLEQGIHQALLDDFTDTVILAAAQFWTWARRQHGL